MPPRLHLPPRSIVQYSSLGSLEATTAAQWRQAGILGALGVLHDAGRVLYDPATTEAQLVAPVLAARAAIGPDVRLMVAFWCGNERAASAETSHLYPWGDEPGWLVLRRNLRFLSRACGAARVYAVLLDAENYRANVDDSGAHHAGYQNPRIAWPGGPRDLIDLRARQYVRALRSAAPALRLGHYLWWRNTDRLRGWLPWVRALRRHAGGSLLTLLEDTYRYPHGHDATIRAAAQVAGPDVLAGYLWDTPELAGGAYAAGIAARRALTPAGVWTFWRDTAADPGSNHQALPAHAAALGKAHGKA